MEQECVTWNEVLRGMTRLSRGAAEDARKGAKPKTSASRLRVSPFLPVGFEDSLWSVNVYKITTGSFDSKPI